ncbi:MAG: hypothetical protein ACYTAF_14755, partial [Planctomycetota bacterium]
MTQPIPDSGERRPRGYRSEEDRKKFTLTAGILCAVFVIAQFVVPFILMMILMPTMMFFDTDWMNDVEAERSAFLDGDLWFVEEAIAGPGKPRKTLLKRVALGSEEDPETAGEIPLDEPWLLAEKGRLWIISSSGVGRWEGGRLKFETGTTRRGDICRPFFYGGKPTVIEETPAGLRLAVFEGSDWTEGPDVHLDGGGGGSVVRDIQVVPAEWGVHIFWEHGASLFHHVGLPLEAGDETDSWESVAVVDGDWYATFLDGGPAVFREFNVGGGGSELEGLRPVGSGWEEFLSCRISSFGGFAALPSGGGGVVIVQQSMMSSLRVKEMRNGAVESERTYGKSSPFSSAWMVMMIVMPIALVLILTAMMKRHRICEFEAAGVRVPFASLARRGAAQIVDAVIAGTPCVAGWAVMFSFM